MFGKKKKLAKQQAELEAAQREREEQERLQREREQQMQQASLEDLIQENKVFVESELLDDDDVDSTQEFEAIAYILKQEEGEALVAKNVDEPVEQTVQPKVEEPVQAPLAQEVAQEQVEEHAVEQAEEVELEEVDETEDAPAVAAPVAPQEESQEEVVYVVEGEEDDDEHVKAAKLVKLPNLIDYMLTQNMTKRMKLNIATLLLSAYQRFKDEPEERKIIVKCMAKVMQALMQ